MNAAPATRTILCDSCGTRATPEHIRERMARLELATRFRPVHIGLLLIGAAPPAALENSLYAWEQQAASSEAKQFIQGLIQILGIDPGIPAAAQLTEFQRRGIYLAGLVECPLDTGFPREDLAAKYGPVLVKRVTYSYKPRQIALLAPVASGLGDFLRRAGLADKLINPGQGIEVPSPEDAEAIARVRASLAAWTGTPVSS